MRPWLFIHGTTANIKAMLKTLRKKAMPANASPTIYTETLAGCQGCKRWLHTYISVAVNRVRHRHIRDSGQAETKQSTTDGRVYPRHPLPNKETQSAHHRVFDRLSQKARTAYLCNCQAKDQHPDGHDNGRSMLQMQSHLWFESTMISAS